MSNHTIKHDIYLQMGIAALLPGLQYAVEQLQHTLDDMRAQLAAMQNGAQPKEQLVERILARRDGAPKRGRPPKEAGHVGLVGRTAKGNPLKAGYWAQFTPEERSAEMRRRRKVQQKNVEAKGAMSDMDKFRAKMRRASKKAWANLTPEQRAERVAKMRKGRAALAKVTEAGAA